MKLGSADIANLRLGGEQVAAVYLGAVQVWPTGLRLAGALNSATALSGAMAVSRPMAGVIDTASSLSAALAVLRPLAGSLASGSSASGEMEVTSDVLLAGALAVAAQSSGAMSVTRTLAGASDALSEMIGAMSVARILAGAAETLSLNSGSGAVHRAMSGSMYSASSTDGEMDVGSAQFPLIENVVTSAPAAGATSHDCSLPTGLTGKRVVIFAASNATTARTRTVPTGWNILHDQGAADGTGQWLMFYRDCDGSEGSTVTVTSSANEGLAFVAMRISGHHAAAPELDHVQYGAGAGDKDPPNLSPSWGGAKTLWLAFASHRAISSTVSTYPTNYSLNQTANDSETSRRAYAAGREVEASSENPGAFTFGGTAPGSAITCAIRPN